MTSDVGGRRVTSGSTFFRTTGPTMPAKTAKPSTDLAQRVNAVAGLTRESLQNLDRAALQQTLQELCAQLGGPTPAGVAAGELHGNGTPRIPSLVAVWLIGRVSEAYSPGQTLVNLSKVPDVQVLRSVGGVARLLIRSIRADMGEDPHE